MRGNVAPPFAPYCRAQAIKGVRHHRVIQLWSLRLFAHERASQGLSGGRADNSWVAKTRSAPSINELSMHLLAVRRYRGEHHFRACATCSSEGSYDSQVRPRNSSRHKPLTAAVATADHV